MFCRPEGERCGELNEMGIGLAAKGQEGSQHLRTGSNPNATIQGQVHIVLGVLTRCEVFGVLKVCFLSY